MSISLSDSDNAPADTSTATALPQYASHDTTTFEVMATVGWQNSYVLLNVGDRVTVSYLSGEWTEQTGVVALHDAADRGGIVCGRSDCVEPYPDFPKGALIGRVSGQIIPIGNAVTFVSQFSRYLALRMNDGDTALNDNSGSVTVRITVEHVH